MICVNPEKYIKRDNWFNVNVCNFFIVGRKVAVDASMCIYQFLIAVRQDGSNLMNEDGETTR